MVFFQSLATFSKGDLVLFITKHNLYFNQFHFWSVVKVLTASIDRRRFYVKLSKDERFSLALPTKIVTFSVALPRKVSISYSVLHSELSMLDSFNLKSLACSHQCGIFNDIVCLVKINILNRWVTDFECKQSFRAFSGWIKVVKIWKWKYGKLTTILSNILKWTVIEHKFQVKSFLLVPLY